MVRIFRRQDQGPRESGEWFAANEKNRSWAVRIDINWSFLWSWYHVELFDDIGFGVFRWLFPKRCEEVRVGSLGWYFFKVKVQGQDCVKGVFSVQEGVVFGLGLTCSPKWWRLDFISRLGKSCVSKSATISFSKFTHTAPFSLVPADEAASATPKKNRTKATGSGRVGLDWICIKFK